MTKKTCSDDIAFYSLEKLGYQVDIIPASDKKEADFIVKYKDNIALVEAKLKEDSDETIENRVADLSTKRVSIVDSKLGRNETYSGIIRSASKQLSSSDKQHDFKVLLFTVSGINTESKKDQLKDTIYGSTLIIEGNKSKVCYFFRNSDFYRRTNIDAIIIGVWDIQSKQIYFELCLNPYAKNYQLLKVSNFIEPFGQAIIDPIELERKGLAYIPDCDIERNLTELQKLSPMYNPILQHLQEKYKTGYLINVDLNAPDIES